MALGFDMFCSEIVLEIKKKYPHIKLVCTIQSILADEVLEKDLHIDIYLDAQSDICTYEDCPMNIWHYYNQHHSLAEYSRVFCRWYDNFEDASEDDIFGLEFENENK